MKRTRTCVAVCLMVVGCDRVQGGDALRTCDIDRDSGSRTSGLELAEGSDQQERGLSGRDEAGAGMVFVWEGERLGALWMKDTRMDLDAAWIDGQGRVIGVVHMEALDLTIHRSPAPVQMIVEMPAGEFEQVGIREGSRMVGISCSGTGTE